jgi:hypothetical protein
VNIELPGLRVAENKGGTGRHFNGCDATAGRRPAEGEVKYAASTAGSGPADIMREKLRGFGALRSQPPTF